MTRLVQTGQLCKHAMAGLVFCHNIANLGQSMLDLPGERVIFTKSLRRFASNACLLK